MRSLLFPGCRFSMISSNCIVICFCSFNIELIFRDANEAIIRVLGDEFRDIELEIVSSGDITIDSDHGLTISTPTPTSLTLLKTVQLPARPISVCHYKGSTYVGLDNNTVARIDSNYQVYKSLWCFQPDWCVFCLQVCPCHIPVWWTFSSTEESFPKSLEVILTA